MKFLARQPILDRNRQLFAYELLFRSGTANFCDHPDLEEASVAMLDTSFLIGLQRLTDGQLGFVNCPRDFLLKDYVSLFPPKAVVVELLETIVPDAEVIEACRALKHRGYLVALDDFADNPSWNPLVEIADFIKVDFRLSAPLQRHSLAARYAGKGIRMLAEKVETHEEFSEAAKMGYSLFQGYFFCRPEILQHRNIPAHKLAYLQLLQAVTAPDFKMDALAQRIKLEPSMTYKLLRYLNSPVFGLRVEIHSVAQALQLLGEREVRKWIAVVAVGVLADGKPDELMKIPLVRGRFCELLAPHAGMADQASDLFLLGLLSVSDAILDQPLDVILEELPVRTDIKEALLEQSVPYRQLLELAMALERADWGQVSAFASAMNIREEQISELYISAVDWSNVLRSEARQLV
ncbi:MAG TPA: HDOD domain-containing protein [Bryobacteraceae bacterium]|nr:HDOD domain-containing protein [Bryobacteraceae bacterium]